MLRSTRSINYAHSCGRFRYRSDGKIVILGLLCTFLASIAWSLSEILQRDLDALVVHLLEVFSELVTALGGAREKLDDVGDRCPGRTIERA
jgi:hypothetical protein